MHAVVVEKILRAQPDVKKIYLLVRAPDDAAAQQRVLHEVCSFFFYEKSRGLQFALHALRTYNTTTKLAFAICTHAFLKIKLNQQNNHAYIMLHACMLADYSNITLLLSVLKIVGKQLFDVLRARHGADFLSFIEEKTSPLAGDVAHQNLGLENARAEQLFQEIDIIINGAATTNFNERCVHACMSRDRNTL